MNKRASIFAKNLFTKVGAADLKME